MNIFAAVIGWPELLVIGFVVVLIFGARKLPELARNVGKMKSQFKKGLDDDEGDEV